MILILSSPSGAGKTTLTRMLLQDNALDLTLSMSVTTRTRRVRPRPTASTIISSPVPNSSA